MKQTQYKILGVFSTAMLFVALVFINANTVFAQTTFNGDYDKTFASPNGFYADGQFPTPNQEVTSFFVGGVVNPDGSVVAGGRVTRTANDRADIYLRKLNASGAIDSSFGTNGFVRTVFSTEFNGTQGNSIPAVIKRQADGKIIVGGICDVMRDANNQNSNIGFGVDWCLVRYNSDGSIDSSFGNNVVLWSNGPNITYNQAVGAGRVATQTNVRENGLLGGAGLSAQLRDIAIQADGRIVAVGETRSELGGTFRTEGVIIRYNSNGSLDTTFGSNGFARYAAASSTAPNCYPFRGFHGVTIQPDGRIIALGNDGTSDAQCFRGKVFVVTRWSANGNFETARRLDGNTSISADEKGTAAIVTKDGGKLLVSGSYQTRPTLLRLNLSDLSFDTTFGTNGIVGYAPSGGNGGNQSLYIKAIQPDGKILGVDTANLPGSGVVRFNPNGTGDLSFGNFGWDNNSSAFGRIRLSAAFFRGTNPDFRAADVALRPNGRLVTFGSLNDGQAVRSFVSQHNTNFRTGFNGDFTNDGRADLSVFRPSNGTWYYLNSANNGFVSFQFGISTDKFSPADFDGDGKTDITVFRDGVWYITQSSNGAFRVIQFGQANDLPRPADFDGDGLADLCVFRPSDGVWYRLNSSGNAFVSTQFGQNGDAPVLADFDGDGRSDLAVFRNGVWFYLQSSDNQFRAFQFGQSGDVPTVGDYDGDSKSDLAVFRNGVWFVLQSSGGGFTGTQFGQSGDKPAAADFNNDGKTDLAVFRQGIWYVLNSPNNGFQAVQFGLSSDAPIPTAYLP